MNPAALLPSISYARDLFKIEKKWLQPPAPMNDTYLYIILLYPVTELRKNLECENIKQF